MLHQYLRPSSVHGNPTAELDRLFVCSARNRRPAAKGCDRDVGLVLADVRLLHLRIVCPVASHVSSDTFFDSTSRTVPRGRLCSVGFAPHFYSVMPRSVPVRHT